MALLIAAEDITSNRERERGSDMQQGVRCRASAHGTRALPTELNGTPQFSILLHKMTVWASQQVMSSMWVRSPCNTGNTDHQSKPNVNT